MTAGNAKVVARTKSTARKGNPKQASRGAAVSRARRAFHEAHDARVWAMELAMYAALIGLPDGAPEAEIRSRLDNASLEELEAWTQKTLNGTATAGAAA